MKVGFTINLLPSVLHYEFYEILLFLFKVERPGRVCLRTKLKVAIC